MTPSQDLAVFIEQGLQWGPFSTPYHQSLITAGFRSRFIGNLAAAVAPQLTIAANRMSGTFTTRYDEERYTGPNSQCRNWFELRCSFSQGSLAETIRNELEVSPETESLRARFKAKRLFRVWTLRDQENARRIEEMLRRFHLLGPGKIPPPFQCPWCDGPVVVGSTYIGCPGKTCFQVHLCRSPDGGIAARSMLFDPE